MDSKKKTNTASIVSCHSQFLDQDYLISRLILQIAFLGAISSKSDVFESDPDEIPHDCSSINTHRLKESDFRFDVTLSRCDHNVISRRKVLSSKRLPGAYAIVSASSWSIVHSYLFFIQRIVNVAEQFPLWHSILYFVLCMVSFAKLSKSIKKFSP